MIDLRKRLMLAVLSLLTASLSLVSAGVAVAQNDAGDAAGAAAGAGFLGFGLICMFIYFAVIIAFLVFWIMMIIDCVKREEAQFPNSSGNSKTIWLLLIILVGGIGAPVYYFMVKRKAPLPK